MAVTPEQQAMIDAEVNELFGDLIGKPKPRTKVVTKEDQVIRDADVAVSKADKNYPSGEDKVVRVRRPDFVTINIAEWERQREEKAAYKRYLRNLDGWEKLVYGAVDQDED